MNSRVTKVLAAAVVILVLATAWQVFAQPAPGGPPGGFGGMMGPGWQLVPQAVVVVGEGLVYVACDGTLTAYDAKTLQIASQTRYWQRAAE